MPSSPARHRTPHDRDRATPDPHNGPRLFPALNLSVRLGLTKINSILLLFISPNSARKKMGGGLQLLSSQLSYTPSIPGMTLSDSSHVCVLLPWELQSAYWCDADGLHVSCCGKNQGFHLECMCTSTVHDTYGAYQIPDTW